MIDIRSQPWMADTLAMAILCARTPQGKVFSGKVPFTLSLGRAWMDMAPSTSPSHPICSKPCVLNQEACVSTTSQWRWGKQFHATSKNAPPMLSSMFMLTVDSTNTWSRRVWICSSSMDKSHAEVIAGGAGPRHVVIQMRWLLASTAATGAKTGHIGGWTGTISPAKMLQQPGQKCSLRSVARSEFQRACVCGGCLCTFPHVNTRASVPVFLEVFRMFEVLCSTCFFTRFSIPLGQLASCLPKSGENPRQPGPNR